ncbi:Hsp20 family protein [Neptunomonas qingdaonensis]|uniref:Molecular chaperone IbpA n=1 Tax=Neptunomonas qingdaonensis TaxID=1045558 RepID=A0A1I2SJ64_9GAMM|nr:Hsp20 family protein [Neptunomonas qingdaonensis]SFG52770.1 molecular chaperone IbpA [Neptunomonas qingdaonensis]
MNTIDLTPLYRSSVGFDRLASLINQTLASETNTNGYPPYNIEMLDENRYAITLAVAGFSQEKIDIQVDKGMLTIRGNKPEKNEAKFLHRGIANRTFERKFNLADHIEVTGADLVNGLLTISLVKETPEAIKPKTIAINTNGQLSEVHKPEEKIEAKGANAA